MKFSAELIKIWDSYKDPERVKALSSFIKQEIEKLGRPINIMEFCGGHTHVILRNALDELLKGYVKFLHGPGCPVCVIAIQRVDLALALAKIPNVIFTTYGDLLRVPGSNGINLVKLRAQGYPIRAVSSCIEAIKIAKENPDKKIIFFAIGFETTSPHTGILIKECAKQNIKNLWVVSNHVIALVVLDYLLSTEENLKIDGIIGPGHVSTITGSIPYERLVEKYKIPIVISGFEPLDIIQSIYLIVKQLKEERREVEVQYNRTVKKEGNKKAQEVLKEVFTIRKTFPWRGLGEVPNSAYEIKEEFSKYDGEKFFEIEVPKTKEHPGCICGEIIKGLKTPLDCKLFGKLCTPQNPVGPCMVSSEGACLAYYKYKSQKLL